MNLDALAAAMRKASGDPVALKISDLLSRWKDDQSNVQELECAVERYIGKTWIASTAEHNNVHDLWSRFRDNAIRGIGGMSMNERLYCFSLFPRWNGSQSDDERNTICARLLANP